ncbi:MAG: DUF357 domain-containing protein [archaeon]
MAKKEKGKKINLVCDARLDKYFSISDKAIKEAKKHIVKSREKDALAVLDMASRYLSDAEYFRKKGDYVNAFAAVNYAHGWIDAGSRLGLFDVSDSNLFVVK